MEINVGSIGSDNIVVGNSKKLHSNSFLSVPSFSELSDIFKTKLCVFDPKQAILCVCNAFEIFSLPTPVSNKCPKMSLIFCWNFKIVYLEGIFLIAVDC